MPPVSIAMSLLFAAAAPQAAAPCPTGAGAIPAELAGWNAMTPLAAARDAAAPTLVPGRGRNVTLVPTPSVRLAAPVAKPPAADTFGGLIAVDIARAGRYRVALGAGAWIDVVRDGAARPSVAHAHGPACSPVRKMVDFDLVPGRYLLQIVGSRNATLPLMIASLPGR